MVPTLAILALLATGAVASYNGNLNYRSPSSEHPSLGIDVTKVLKRNLAKRDNTDWDPASLSFTHGVASVRQCTFTTMKIGLLGRATRTLTRSYCGRE